MSSPAQTLVPPLHDGDCLDSVEFIRRWEALPDLKHAELLGGMVHMPSPVSSPHSLYHFALSGWLSFYKAHTPGCEGGLEGTWLMSKDDVPQPDLALWLLPELGGKAQVDGKYPTGAPELIVEVAASSKVRDLGIKLELYERMGVREYLVALTSEREFVWKQLVNGTYQSVESDLNGVLRSPSFPGLWLHLPSLWNRDQAALLAMVSQGFATAEHAQFVAHSLAASRVN